MPAEKTSTDALNASPTQSDTTNQNGGGIDFSKFSLGNEKPAEQNTESVKTFLGNVSETKQESIQPAPSLASQFDLHTENNQKDVDIQTIQIKEENEQNRPQIQLGTSTLNKKELKKKESELSDMDRITLGYVLISIGVFFGVIFGGYINYLQNIDTPETQNPIITQAIQTVEKAASKYLNINEYDELSNQTNLFDQNGKEKLQNILQNSSLTYPQKKDILSKNIDQLTQNIFQTQTDTERLKNQSDTRGIIPDQIYTIVNQEGNISNIKKAIVLREEIKFITAIKVFSFLESFIQSVANITNKDALYIESFLDELNKDGEKNIIAYTNTCYLNPYEIDDNCMNIQDFENYFLYGANKKKIDTDLFKQIIAYIDLKMKQSDIPSFTIRFDDINPKNNTIQMTVEINTNAQDESYLIKQGILNPHVFIVSHFVNFLKQSILVIGENIKINELKTKPKTIKIGSTVFTVNNTTLTFDLPIQNANQREISDFLSIDTQDDGNE